MKANIDLKSLVVAVVLAIGAFFWPSYADAVDSERMAQVQAIRQTRAERFDKILQMARIQHAWIEQWHKKAAKARAQQKKPSQKNPSAVAMKE